MIRVQTNDFDVGEELKKLTAEKTDIGGVCSFVGLVRDFSADGENISEMTLEHYPAMTEKQLAEIESEAHKRWKLEDTLIIHRTGKLMPGDQIVLVMATSAHREDAFSASAFIMDWLKTKAPFWKKEQGKSGAKWVEARDSDSKAVKAWEKK